jgi:hypothetical protein
MQEICDKDGIALENREEDVQTDHLVKQTFVGSWVSGQTSFTLLDVFLNCWISFFWPLGDDSEIVNVTLIRQRLGKDEAKIGQSLCLILA